MKPGLQLKLGRYAMLGLTMVLFACDNQKETSRPQTPQAEPYTAPSDALFSLLDTGRTGVGFINEVMDGKEFNVINYRNYYNGGGVAIGDINADGLPDVYLTANMGQNKLYLNKGDMKFEDITVAAGVGGERGWSTGVVMSDVNGDGLLDIYVCNSGDVEGDDRENELFINQGNLTFEERAADFGLADKGYSTHAAFFDYDLDGDLDCYILNNSFHDPSKIRIYKDIRYTSDSLGGDKLMRNDGERFTAVTKEAGILNSQIGFGLGVAVGDINKDMLPDIFVSNDFWERDYLYVNQGDGTYSEELSTRMGLISASSMGADIADINNDGEQDLFTTDMLPADNYRLKSMTIFDPFHIGELKVREDYHHQFVQNALQLNDGDGQFSEIASLVGVAATDWSWGALIFDFQNDGNKDIFVSNGIYHDITYLDFVDFLADRENIDAFIKQKGRADFRDFLELLPITPMKNYAFSNKGDLKFTNEADELGLGHPGFSNGSAYGDLDLDGDLDLVVNNVNMPVSIYQANTNNAYLKVKFEGPEGNKLGIGAVVNAETSDGLQSMQNFNTRGFQSSIEPVLVFGLGQNDAVDKVTVTWPGGTQQQLLNVAANQTITVRFAEATTVPNLHESKEPTLFKERKELIENLVAHKEDDYDDFDHQRLLLRMKSTEGPKLVVGDINGDQLEDFIQLGATNDDDKVYVQQRNGRFRRIPGIFNADKQYESTGGVLLDWDDDGDNDLIIVSGGNDHRRPSPPVRFYENNGVGMFEKSSDAVQLSGNFGAVCASVEEGVTKVFIGGRLVQGRYGELPKNYLYQVANGSWTDITPSTFADLGMVTDAKWVDLNADGKRELVVAGDWMSITIVNQEGGMNKIEGTSGWWNTLEVADLDGDGREDFVVGNWGDNSKLKASKDRPLTMHVKDFDENGQTDQVYSWFPPLDDRAYPFAMKSELTRQLPHLKKKILKHHDYAGMQFEDLFSEQERNGAIKHTVNNLQSGIIWNNEDGYAFQPLPIIAQKSPVYAIVVEDFNNDGQKDLWLGGNLHKLVPQLGYLGASKGVLLEGQGRRRFEVAKGPDAAGEVRDASIFSTESGKVLLISINNQSPRVFQY
ncbi:MAG: VCBS repeat-containing protein [Cyclobacteriaceae bacterium]